LRIGALRNRVNCVIPSESFSENQDIEKDILTADEAKKLNDSFKTKWKNNGLCCDLFCKHLQTFNKKRAQIGDKDICKPDECRKILSCFALNSLGSHNRYFQMAATGTAVKRVHCPELFIYKGTQGQVLTAFGIWLSFVITEYDHACFWSWNVASIKATGHRIQTVKTGGCYLWFEVPIIAAPYILVCQMTLGRIKNLLSESTELTA
jgi:hypothetical protein